MDKRDLATICAFIASNWPAAQMVPGTLDLYALELGGYDAADVITTLRASFASAEFPPTPMQLREAVAEMLAPTPDVDELVAEVYDAIERHGYTGRPEWSHPAIAEYVAHQGGWPKVCEQTPARAVRNAATMSAAGTSYAQMRDQLRACLGRRTRAEREERVALPPGRVSAAIASLADSLKLEEA